MNAEMILLPLPSRNDLRKMATNRVEISFEDFWYLGRR